MKKLMILILATSLTACGGGSSGPMLSASTSTTLEGRVIDGYISGATVCLDLNNNYLCDINEPSAVTSTGGFYEFTYDGIIPAGTQILADIPITALDEDLGPIEKPYTMMAPSDNPSVVTPLTTLISQEIIDSGKEMNSETAEATVKRSLGVSETTKLLDNNFVENNQAELQQVAEVLAVAFAETRQALELSDDLQDISVGDVTEAAIKAASLNASQLVVNGQAIVSREQAKQTTSTLISGQLQNIVASTKSGDGNVVDLLDAFTSGNIFILWEGEYGALDENKNGVRDDDEEDKYHDYLVAEWLYFPEAASPDLLLDVDSDLKIAMLVGEEDGEWLRLFDDFDSERYLINNLWKAAKSDRGEKIEENCINDYDSDVPLQKFCLVRKDVSSLAIDDILPGICEDDNGVAVSGCDADAKFPAESYVYDLAISVPENEYGGIYELWTRDDWSGYVSSNDQTIRGFIDEHTDLKTSFVGDYCNVAFRIASFDAELKTGVMQWADAGVYGCSGMFYFDAVAESEVEETEFEVLTFGETEILKVLTPLVFRENNPDERRPYIIFSAAMNDLGVMGVYSGEFTPSNTVIKLPFTGDTDNQIFISRAALDFAFEQRGITPFAYELF